MAHISLSRSGVFCRPILLCSRANGLLVPSCRLLKTTALGKRETSPNRWGVENPRSRLLSYMQGDGIPPQPPLANDAYEPWKGT